MNASRTVMPRPLAHSLGRFTSSAAILMALALAGSNRAKATDFAWDVDTLTNGVITAGGGTWDNAALNFTDTLDTIPHFAWNNATNAVDIAVFGGTGGTAPYTVTVGTITAGGVTFGAPGYFLTGGTLTMGGGTITTAVDGRINSVITGAGGLTKVGNGTLVLGGANTFSGPLNINAGKVLLAGLGVGAVAGGGAGNETIVASGATLDLGGQAYGNQAPGSTTAEVFRIQGAGFGGIGALVNSGASQNNATSKIVLTGDATVSAGSGVTTSFNAGGTIAASAGGRFDVRNSAAPTAGQEHLDLNGFTLTKIGGHQMAIVNGDVSNGTIIVDEGHFYFEAGTIALSGVNVIANPNGKFGWWNVGTTGANQTANVTVNGGTVGDITSTSGSQTVNSPISITGAINPNFVANQTTAGVVTTLAGAISQSSFTGTNVAKRGAGILAFTNVGNSFNAPISIYQGTLRADYTTTLSGGVPPAAALTPTDTPLGVGAIINLQGGTLAIRANMDNNNTQQVFNLGKAIVLDNAPGGMSFDRIGNTSQTDKHVRINSLTFAAASAANGWSIGQNQFTFTQANTHRIEIPELTMNSDTVLATGDHTLSGNILSANRSSLLRSGGNTTQFIAPGTHEFGAFFNTGGSLRVGSGFGTPATSNVVTVGSGRIYIAPGASATWRTPTNLAAGNIIEVISQRQAHGVVNFEQFTSLPAHLRSAGSGVLGIGSAAAFGNLDLSKIGDGTWRVGSGLVGSGAGTIVGTITPGAGNVLRMGAGGAAGSTVTLPNTNSVTGSTVLEVGSPLINGGQTTNGTGTLALTAANDYSGGTLIHRGATLLTSAIDSTGSGTVEAFGTFGLQGASGVLTLDGLTNVKSPILRGGSTLFLQNAALTGTTDLNRWGDDEPVSLIASAITLNSRNNNASTTREEIGAVSYAGGSSININRQNATAGNNVQLDVDSLSRVGQGTLEIVRSTGTGAGFGTANILKAIGTAPSTIALSSGTMIAPHITVVDGTRLVNFADYSVSTGILNATPTNVVNTAAFPTGFAAGNQYVYVDFASGALTSTLGDNPDVAALKVGAGQATASATTIAAGAGTSIRIRTGGLIFSGDATSGFFSNANGVQATVNPAINFNDGTNNVEALVNVRGGTTGILNGVIAASALTKFGGGTLALSANNNAFTGPVNVNAGTLQSFGPAATGTLNTLGTGAITLAGGQLNLRSNNSAVTGTINHTLVNSITVAQNIPIAVIDVNRSGADTASSGTFIFNPAAASSPGLRLLGSPGEQGQTLTVSGGNYAVQFGTNALNSFAGNVTINNAVTLTLNNAPTITGTAPIITKSGAGNFIVGVAAGGMPVSPNTTVVLNAGTLELRSITAFGTGGSGNTSLVLNGGTLNLRRDTAGTYGGAVGTPYPLSINGASTISVDRTGGSNVSAAIGIGKLTVATNGTLTINNGNGFYPTFPGMEIRGAAFIASNVGALGSQETAASFTSGNQVSGGALIKSGSGHLHLLNAGNTYDGGTYVQAGIVRLRAANAAGTGNIWVNPGATLDINNSNNLGVGQQVIVRSSSAFLPMLSVNVDGVAHPTLNVDTSGAPVGIVGLSNGSGGIYNVPIDLSTLYGGNWSLGGVSTGAYDPRYTASTLTAGNGNLYRLGGGGTSMVVGHDSAGAAHTNLLTGPNDVRLGFDSGNILPVNATNFQYAIAGVNDYSGGETLIHRGMTARIFAAPDLVNDRTGFSNSAVDVFGVMSLSGSSSLKNSAGTGHINAVTLHPGSALFLDNANAGVGSGAAVAAANIADRWHDTTPLALNGAMLNFIGGNNVPSSETIGPVTYSRGARVRVQLTGTGNATLTLGGLASGGSGSTLTVQTSGPTTLGGADKILIAGAVPVPVNGMLSPAIVNSTTVANNTTSGQSFVTYGANGLENIVYDDTVNGTYIPGSLAPTDKVDVVTGALALQDNPVVYALRHSQSINLGAFNTITIRSGGLLGHLNNTTINPHLVFNDGVQNVEAKIYVGTSVSSNNPPANITTTINGTITANGVTKFGSGNLTINTPQPQYASGWTINSGTLQINDAEGLGQSVPGNAVTINGSLTTGGSAGQNFSTQSILNFNRNNGTPEMYTFSGGPITVVNEGTIRIGAGVDDRVLKIPEVILDSSSTASGVSLTIDVPNNRHRGIIPNLTLQDNATIRVLDAGSTADTGRVTAAVVETLTGTNKEIIKIGNRTLELPNDNSSTFVGGGITVSQGTVRVRHNGALGDATSITTVERNATLEIDSTAFSPVAAVVQLPGSIERWNRDDARSGNYDLPTGVNLQLNTNLVASRTIGVDGGTVEGFLWIDHPATAVERVVGPNVTLNLISDSYVGQNILQGQGYDAGRQPNAGQPFGSTAAGAFLRIEGPITGANLTKTGNDTVTLANEGNTYGNTTVELGVLRIGANNALGTGALTLRTGGTFDLFGFNQLVTGLGTQDSQPNPGGTGVGVAGKVTNSAITDNLLLVNNTADYTYNGTIERNVALTKSGSGNLKLAGANTYTGTTTIADGVLVLTGSISGTPVIDVKEAGTFDVSGVSGGFKLLSSQTLTGSGVVLGGLNGLTVEGTVAPGSSPGIMGVVGPVSFLSGSTFAVEILDVDLGIGYDQLSVAGGPLNIFGGNLTLTLGYAPSGTESYTIIDNASAGPITGVFANIADGGTISATYLGTQYDFVADYQGGDGNDLVLTVPEPTSALMLLGGLGVIGMRRRRQTR